MAAVGMWLDIRESLAHAEMICSRLNRSTESAECVSVHPPDLASGGRRPLPGIDHMLWRAWPRRLKAPGQVGMRRA